MRPIPLWVVVLTTASCEPLPEPTAVSPPALRAGTWVRFGPKSVIGHGTDHLVRVERSGDAWRIERTTVEIPRVGRGEPVRVWSLVLEPVYADGSSLEYEGGQGPVRVTYRYDGDRWVVLGWPWLRSHHIAYEPLDARQPAHRLLLDRVAGALRVEPPSGMALRHAW